MPDFSLRVRFLSDWRIGSGLGDGSLADEILNRDADGLPTISGRALKGALREGAWRLGLCRDDLARLEDRLWGSRSTAKISNNPGSITVGTGHLPGDIRSWLLSCPLSEREKLVGDMTFVRAQTALNEKGTVVPHSLRTMECGIAGMSFESIIRVDAPWIDEYWLRHYMSAVCAAVKSMGADRSRGLGACEFCIDGQECPVSLPDEIDLQEQGGGL